jgi:hypothetical protein
MKINLIIGGTEKGGTTTLHYLLKSHPKILMPRAKELHFFSNENYFMKGGVDVDYRQYHRMFIGSVMSSMERDFLIDIFKDEVKKLEVILQKDLSPWLK